MTERLTGAEDAPAKVNLALHVRRRRADGYHDLETLFAFTRFGDRLEAWEAEDWSLDVEGPMATDAGPLQDNLVLRAARAFAEVAGSDKRFAFRLSKRIPVAAGLGGGSADAAAALRLLNRLCGDPLGRAEIEALGGRLGADIPACVRSATVWGEGVGDDLREGPDLKGRQILLVNPRVAVPTGPVFKLWDGIDRGPLSADWRAGRNDLQAPAIALQPVIAKVLDWMAGLPGVELARMSGSGATCLALLADDAPEIAPPDGWWAIRTELI